MRTITITFTTALTALTLAACGGGGGGESRATASEDKALEGALRFARCMRAQGIDFPDPKRDGKGLVAVGPGAGQNPDNPRTRAAMDKCGKHLEAGGGDAPDAAQQAKMQDAFVRYARCMRGEGVDVPDPKPGAGGLVTRVGEGGAPDLDSPRYRTADRICHKHLAALDEAVETERTP